MESAIKNAYFRFMTLLSKLDHGHPIEGVDALARQLLDAIALHHHQGTPLTVTTAMALESIASPATIHRKLEDLKSHGLVEAEFQDGNMRTKYLVPSRLATKRYERLHRELEKSLQST